MFARLIESKRVRDRSAGGTAASIFAHSALIGLAAYATLGAAPVEPPADPVVPNIIYQHVPAPAGPVHSFPRCGECMHLPVPGRIDVPPVDLPPGPVIDVPVTIGTPGPVHGDPGAPSRGAPGDSGGVFEIVEEPARALPGNPHPEYPSLLRSARVTGVVSARFVVDTAGRVESGSIAFEAGSDVLFEASVRRALLASRYTPAVTSGRRVRMLVRQDFAFRLTP
jgi:TonB family protein